MLTSEPRWKTRGAVAMMAAAMVVLTAMPAHAAGVRRDTVGTCVAPPQPTSQLDPIGTVYPYNPFDDFGVTTHYNYWSVVATRGGDTLDSDVSLLRTSICGPTSASSDPSAMDWVAVDSNSGRVATGPFVARFSGYRPPGSTAGPSVQFVDGHRTLATTTPYVAQPIGDEYSNWIIDIRDMYLYAGQTVRIVFAGPVSELHVVGSDPARSSTWYRTPVSTVGSAYFPTPPVNPQDGSLTVTAPLSGWYGVVVGHRLNASGPTTLYVTTL